jgi:hypothetical protein
LVEACQTPQESVIRNQGPHPHCPPACNRMYLVLCMYDRKGGGV